MCLISLKQRSVLKHEGGSIRESLCYEQPSYTPSHRNLIDTERGSTSNKELHSQYLLIIPLRYSVLLDIKYSILFVLDYSVRTPVCRFRSRQSPTSFLGLLFSKVGFRGSQRRQP